MVYQVSPLEWTHIASPRTVGAVGNISEGFLLLVDVAHTMEDGVPNSEFLTPTQTETKMPFPNLD